MKLGHYATLLAYLSEPRHLPCPPPRVLREGGYVHQDAEGRWVATARGRELSA